MTLKKTAVTVSAIALALGLAACGGDSGNGGGAGLITAWGLEPQNPLIPANTNETGGGRILDLIYSGLVSYDTKGEVHNEMAKNIEQTSDTKYKVTLKDDITFQDGSPVTSANFVDAWNYAVKNELLASSFFEPIKGYKEGVDSLEGLKILDDKNFTIELDHPESDFTQRLGYSAFFPLHKSAYDDIDAYGDKPIGNGPYKLESWNHNQDATLVPNDEYDGEREVKNDGVKFVFYSSSDAAYADLLSGNLDILDQVPDSAFTKYEDELGGRSVNQPSAVFQSFTIPEKAKHFEGEEGKLRREALSMAVDRDEITKTIFQGTRTPATDFTAPVIPGHSDSLKGADVLKYNSEKAKELWKKADDISEFSGEFTIAYNADGGHQAWVDATANGIKNTLGIEAVGKPYPDFKSLRDDITNRKLNGAFRTGWQADYPSLGNFLVPLYTTNASSNDGDYSNPEFDKLMKEAASASDINKAKSKYNEAQEVLLKDLPAIPLWYSNVTGGWSENVDNVVFTWNSLPAYNEITKK
ncbi:peptide ABC transporter substrate-binding protein [Corynebacterium anserum]|uniref:ABC transporter substrate-binding protein n=1 Tax=Corynebacterium anserum TaxID=2684406 RepID=A0A7G7YMI3_9CORY|nr:ABC transporter substrate-binding protein [Corynebacterium anserum]MBC2681072.1 ABC transporter substrate-binding protein [Corynebacterium anserum]QNH95703.1 ABC transporter substrate-binding protein [Corynebacterium anserum]